jgi:hypothetical protein
LKLFNYSNDSNEIIICMSVMGLIKFLINLDYFNYNFKPYKCDCEQCDKILEYDLIIRCRCGCENLLNTMHLLCSHIGFDVSYQIYGCLVKYESKIVPIINDFKLLHKIFEKGVLDLPLCVKWCDDKKVCNYTMFKI